jgi:hypothetical protein
MVKKYLLFLIFLSLLSFISADVKVSYPDPAIITLTQANPSQVIEFENLNLSQTATVSLNLSPSLSNVIQLSSTSLSIASRSSLSASIKSNAPNGTYTGYINYASSNSGSIPITAIVTANQTSSQTGCQINPSLVSYTQTIQKGAKIPLPKITFNPIGCSGSLVLTASSVSIQGGIITTSGQKPVYISSVVSDGVNLQIDTEGLNTQTYSPVLRINAFGKSFEIPFTIVITGGTDPSSFNIGNLPTCSLTSVTMTLNSSYSLVCSNLIPDVTISPVIDTDYIEGTGVDSTTNQFSWFFRPKKYGNTIIKAEFKYLGVPVGTPFSQEVRITSSGSSIAGTNLRFLFVPSLDLTRDNDLVLIQLVDNKTNSLVTHPRIFVDARELNSSSETFEFRFKAGTTYEFRGRADGYDDITQAFSINPKELPINITPSSGDTSTIFLINSSLANVTYTINGRAYPGFFSGSLPAGINIIQASKTGFLTTTINFSVADYTTILNGFEVNFQKGVEQTLVLSKNSSTFIVWYQKDLNSMRESYYSGVGSNIKFTPKKAGIYTIESDGKTVQSYNITGFDWGKKFLWIPVWVWIIILVLIAFFAVIFIIKKNRYSGDNALTYQVGS